MVANLAEPALKVIDTNGLALNLIDGVLFRQRSRTPALKRSFRAATAKLRSAR
jgi:hypothetical protein